MTVKFSGTGYIIHGRLHRTRRELLHVSKLDKFLEWARSKGFAAERTTVPTNPYIMAQVYKPCKQKHFIHTRNRGDYYTIPEALEGLVVQFIRETKI